MIRFGKLAVLQVALIAAAVIGVHAAPEPLQILRQSIMAPTKVDFSGVRTVVIFKDGQKVHGVQQKIDCDAPDDMRIVVIAPESQRGKLCLTSGRDHWEYNPSAGRAVYTKLSAPEKVCQTRLSELEHLADRMKMQYAGSDSIAGRPAHVVKVYTTTGLPVKKTWVDTQHHLELKTQRFDSHGQVKSSAYYTSIDYSPSFQPGLFSFEPPEGVTVVRTERDAQRMPLEQVEQKAGFEAVLPTYLPPGYHFSRDRTGLIEVNGQPTIWLSFTNGADTFSLFERRASGEMGQVKHDRAVTWQDGTYQFTLMGTLASDELQQVKSSIKP
jgi:outer membrane lipoprotein-sorting protein